MTDAPDGGPHCMFCQRRTVKSQMTGEHVVPRWLATQLLGTPPYTITDQPRNLTRNVKNFEMKADRVCRDCNTGWMAQMEGRVQRDGSLLRLIRGVDAGECLLDSDSQELLATWIVKTAFMFDKISATTSVFTANDRLWLAENRCPSPGTTVLIGSASGSRLMPHWQNRSRDGSTAISTLQIRRIVLQTIVTSPIQDVYAPSIVATHIWPIRDEIASTPPRVSFSDRDMDVIAGKPLGDHLDGSGIEG